MQKPKAKNILMDILSGITQTIAGKVVTVALTGLVAAAGAGTVIHHVNSQKAQPSPQSVSAQAMTSVNKNKDSLNDSKATESSSYSSKKTNDNKEASSQTSSSSKSSSQQSSGNTAADSSVPNESSNGTSDNTVSGESSSNSLNNTASSTASSQ